MNKFSNRTCYQVDSAPESLFFFVVGSSRSCVCVCVCGSEILTVSSLTWLQDNENGTWNVVLWRSNPKNVSIADCLFCLFVFFFWFSPSFSIRLARGEKRNGRKKKNSFLRGLLVNARHSTKMSVFVA